MYLDPALVQEYLLDDGDLLLSRSGTIGRSFIYRKDQHGLCAYAGYLVRFVLDSSLLPQFAFYFTKSQTFFDWLNLSVIESTIGNVNGQKYANMPLPFPPLPEQRAIAVLLDRETAKLDTLIAKKERLIALLQEQRAALISHAVTRGLDPAAPLKDSGVPWLGQIPAHWETRRLKFLTPFVTSGSRGWARYYSDDGPLFLRIGNLSRTSIDLDLGDIEHVSPPEGAEGERTRVSPGDVLISITAYIGSVAVVAEGIGEAYVNQHIALTRPQQHSIAPRWLGYYLLSRAGQEQFGLLLYGGTKDGLGLDEVRNLLILLPPLAEQRAIAAYLDHQTAKLDALISVIRQAIEKVEEERTALIAAAVTGKIDARAVDAGGGEAGG